MNKEKEQDNEQSTTTQESVVDDEHEVVIIADDGKNNKEPDIQAANEEQQGQAEQDNIGAVDEDELTEFRQPLQVQSHLEVPRILVQLGHIQCT